MELNGNGHINDSVLVLGVRGEVIPYDFTEWGEGAECVVQELHMIAYRELVKRKLADSWVWIVRVQTMCVMNNIYTVGQIMNMSVEQVNKLNGCGVRVRSEIYDTFRNEFGIQLEAWNPKHYQEKWTRYRF